MKPVHIVAGCIVTTVLLASSGHAERLGGTQTWVDMARPFPYRIEGGSDEFAASGEICDLMKTFVLEGAGVKVKFIPKSTRRGRYTYAGKVGGADVSGNGTYEVQYDGLYAIGIVASDSSAVDGAEVYRLRPMRGGCRG